MDKVITLRVTEVEAEAIKQAAIKDERSVNKWAKRALLRATEVKVK
jgi:predicted HicB family RNase H-like nuclease